MIRKALLKSWSEWQKQIIENGVNIVNPAYAELLLFDNDINHFNYEYIFG